MRVNDKHNKASDHLADCQILMFDVHHVFVHKHLSDFDTPGSVTHVPSDKEGADTNASLQSRQLDTCSHALGASETSCVCEHNQLVNLRKHKKPGGPRLRSTSCMEGRYEMSTGDGL